MAAGKAIASSRFPGLLQNREIGIQHPGTGYPAQQLQKLVGHGSEKAHRHDIVALLLIHAPEYNQGKDKKRSLLTQRRNCQHQLIESRNPDFFQQI